MCKYTVKMRFRDKETQVIYEVGTVLELTAERMKEITDKLGEEALEVFPETETTEKKETTKAKKADKKSE
ncbi:hypothetical protein [Listeria fleischmannii]|uniref:Uncharacterized protein n=1 Tax=Listeria fleischmannii FSL S10-1203 TaxID=1265822 RepID=W7DNM6_9LIST|nr:hypothetical protein [Listeria fleischmannii]EUJ59550.1 hypothetical protein MCOL2_05600 [Listeria fleischmannii FSL S10-1203]